jgi:hypothetical protein
MQGTYKHCKKFLPTAKKISTYTTFLEAMPSRHELLSTKA